MPVVLDYAMLKSLNPGVADILIDRVETFCSMYALVCHMSVVLNNF